MPSGQLPLCASLEGDEDIEIGDDGTAFTVSGYPDMHIVNEMAEPVKNTMYSVTGPLQTSSKGISGVNLLTSKG